MVRRLTVEGASEMPSRNSLFWHHGRYVGGETEKSFDARIENGFWSRFVCGPDVLDVRYRGFVNDALPVFDGATGIELDDLEHDGKRLPFGDSSHDVVFANHCLHHIAGHIGALQDWHRVTRAGGHIIIAVPSAALYEKKVRPPSRWGQTPQRFYSPASLLAEIETALAPNTYRVRFLEEDDTAYSYAGGVDTLPTGCHELIAVLEKITPPRWTPEA
jgi:SAM-dependent methyltransferase